MVVLQTFWVWDHVIFRWLEAILVEVITTKVRLNRGSTSYNASAKPGVAHKWSKQIFDPWLGCQWCAYSGLPVSSAPRASDCRCSVLDGVEAVCVLLFLVLSSPPIWDVTIGLRHVCSTCKDNKWVVVPSVWFAFSSPHRCIPLCSIDLWPLAPLDFVRVIAKQL